MPHANPKADSTGPGRRHASQLPELLLATEDVEQFVQQLVGRAATAIDGGLSAGVTLARDGHPATVASSDQDAAQYDEVQYDHDEGPCLTAMRTGQVILIDDLVGDDRFGEYRDHALALGLRSTMALPLDGGDHAVGALNLYSRHPHSFGKTAKAEAERFAAEASRALALVVRLAHHVELSEHLQTALTSRSAIDHAIGIIMGQNRCDADAAFAVLRTASQNRNVKLRVIAAEIVAAVSNHRPGDGHPPQG